MAKREIYLILNNIRSAYNVGAIFRTADAVGVTKIYLCGYTPHPKTNNLLGENDKVAKTALGAEKTITWEHQEQVSKVITKLKKDGLQLVALEQTPNSTDYRKFKPKFPLAIIAGNEVGGLSNSILKHFDKTIELPMKGKKESLNVSIALSIVLYSMLN